MLIENKKTVQKTTELPMAYRVLVFDFETSDRIYDRQIPPKDYENIPARIVQIGAMIVKLSYSGRPGRIIEKYNTLVRPDGFTITEGAQSVHKITNEIATDKGINIKEGLEKLTDMAKKVNAICGHNINSFDTKVILSELFRANMITKVEESPFGYLPRIDTMIIGRHLCKIPNVKNPHLKYKFPKLKEMYKIITGKDSNPSKEHDALYDVSMTYEILDIITSDKRYIPHFRCHVPEMITSYSKFA